MDRTVKNRKGVVTGNITPIAKFSKGLPIPINMRSPMNSPLYVKAPDQIEMTDPHRQSITRHTASPPTLLVMSSSRLKAIIPTTHQHEHIAFWPARQ
jgi:hypothetical protein